MAKRGLGKNDLDFSKLEPGLSPEGEIEGGGGGEGGGIFDKLKPKVQQLFNRILSVIKLILGLCFLAFVYTGSVGFLQELKNADRRLQDDFWSGVITFIVIYLFFWEPMKVYQKGQKILTVLFKFFAPLVKFAPYVLPIYTILIFAFYPLVNHFYKHPLVLEYFIFFGGLSIALHLVMTAKTLKSKPGDFLKANYIFGFSLVYILNLLLIAIVFQLILDKFSFFNFFQGAYAESDRIWHSVFKQIFIPGPTR
jgi:hypothetical protein